MITSRCAVDELPGEAVSDEELTEIALAADPDGPLDPRAQPLEFFAPTHGVGLPQWYMPQVTRVRCSGWRMPVTVGIVAVLLALEALGLCSIFGQVVIG
jgi:hypothetical protein